jgi:hypothetical protein
MRVADPDADVGVRLRADGSLRFLVGGQPPREPGGERVGELRHGLALDLLSDAVDEEDPDVGPCEECVLRIV